MSTSWPDFTGRGTFASRSRRRARQNSRESQYTDVVHAFTDGRDTPPEWRNGIMAELHEKLPAAGFRLKRLRSVTTPWIATSLESGRECLTTPV